MADEPSTPSRRAVIAAGICLVAVPGCSVLDSESAMLDLLIFNQTDSQFTADIYLKSEGGQSNGEGRTEYESIEIEPQGGVRRENIAESQQYLIEYDVDKIVDGDPLETDHGHAHFYPADSGENPSIAFDIVGSGTIKKRIL